jgi:hypothetical protein
MDIGWKSARAFIALMLLYIFWTAGQTNVALAAGGSMNGAAGQMPASMMVSYSRQYERAT